jgi:adenosine deaminase
MLRAFVALLFAAVAAFSQPVPLNPIPSMAGIERRFVELRKSPLELYAFLYRMPKGGDLHNHLSGAVYAETFLKAAAEEHLCIDTKALAIVAAPCGEGAMR